MLSSVFFFPRENKSCPWKPFLAFFPIFSRAIFVFHGQFFAVFWVFSRAKIWFFSGFTGNFVFSRAKFWILKVSRATLYFHGQFFGVFSRARFWFSRGKKKHWLSWYFFHKKKTQKKSWEHRDLGTETDEIGEKHVRNLTFGREGGPLQKGGGHFGESSNKQRPSWLPFPRKSHDFGARCCRAIAGAQRENTGSWACDSGRFSLLVE